MASGHTAAVFVGCCCQYLFKTAHSIFVLLLSSFFSNRFVNGKVVQPYSSPDTATAWKNSGFILSEKSDFPVIYNLSIAIDALP